MVSQANGPDNVDGYKSPTAQGILDGLNTITAESFANDGERNQAVIAAHALVSRLETPWEFVARFCMGQVRIHPRPGLLMKNSKSFQPALGAALKVGKDLQLFEKWHEHGDGEMTGEQLAGIVDCDPKLLG